MFYKIFIVYDLNYELQYLKPTSTLCLPANRIFIMVCCVIKLFPNRLEIHVYRKLVIMGDMTNIFRYSPTFSRQSWSSRSP